MNEPSLTDIITRTEIPTIQPAIPYRADTLRDNSVLIRDVNGAPILRFWADANGYHITYGQSADAEQVEL